MPVPLTAREPVQFFPPALHHRNDELIKAGKPPISIMCRVPTMFQRDAFSAELVRGGVVHYSQSQIRDLMRAGIAFLYRPDQFDYLNEQMEGMWLAADSLKECQVKRTDRYIELMERENALPPEKRMSEADMERELQAIQPAVQMPEADRVRISALQQDIMARYEPMQKTLADLAEQDVRRNWLCIEIYVQGWTGLEHTPDGNGRGGLTRPEAEWLRMQIGAKAFDQTADFIFAMHSIDEDEEKNLASLTESFSSPPGSTPPEESTESQNGPSVGEPTSETPGISSPTTPDTSSSSGSLVEPTTDESTDTPTVEA